MRSPFAAALACVLLGAAPAGPAQTAPPQPPTVQDARAHWAVQGADEATQRLIDRGVMMLYAFDVGEARVAFGQALARNPNLALAYWGEAEADTIDINLPQTQRRRQARCRCRRRRPPTSRARERDRADAGRCDLEALREGHQEGALHALRRRAERLDEDAPRRSQRAHRRRVRDLERRGCAVRRPRRGHAEGERDARRPRRGARARTDEPRRAPFAHPPARRAAPGARCRPRRGCARVVRLSAGHVALAAHERSHLVADRRLRAAHRRQRARRRERPSLVRARRRTGTAVHANCTTITTSTSCCTG